MASIETSNFRVLAQHDAQLMRLGRLAERYFAEDPNTCLLKLRQLTEGLAQLVASKVGAFSSIEEKQADLLSRLQSHGILPREVATLFHQVRKAGNEANHAPQLRGGSHHRTALTMLRFSWQLTIWFHRTFEDERFASGPFLPPQSPTDESSELKAELESLRVELDSFRAAHQQTTEALNNARSEAETLASERSFWEGMAAEAEQAKHALAQRLQALQTQNATQSPTAFGALVGKANAAAATLQLSEADARRLIDQQLAQAGWTADSTTLTYAKGARPQPGKHLAIAEWPTDSGPADYMLFSGLQPLAVVEAKRRNIDVSAALQQAKRYSRGFIAVADTQLHSQNWGSNGEFRVPFAFSANGRPYLRQLATKSGVWFCDLRRPDKIGHALDGWYTPEGLQSLLRRDEDRANAELTQTGFEYGFALRHYQQNAIRETERRIAQGQREILLAMATGTGKTKTCVALIYRLLNAQRFRRILFLVDRSALGEQAANAFKDTRMERFQTFADTFGIKELDTQTPAADTAVHLATVQGMMKRVLSPADGVAPPTVDQYDCIIVDECHRGYTLDREMSDTELGFRSFDDYISKYRRVLDYFDAVKIGLTATPALHTTQIFGAPAYSYSYREAVVDGFLTDYEPPIKLYTELSSKGMTWRVGEEVKVYHADRGQIELFKRRTKSNCRWTTSTGKSSPVPSTRPSAAIWLRSSTPAAGIRP